MTKRRITAITPPTILSTNIATDTEHNTNISHNTIQQTVERDRNRRISAMSEHEASVINKITGSDNPVLAVLGLAVMRWRGIGTTGVIAFALHRFGVF